MISNFTDHGDNINFLLILQWQTGTLTNINNLFLPLQQ
jgi:hypothetical protein